MCYNKDVKRGREELLASLPSAHRQEAKTSQKPLDKPLNLWYTNNVNRGRKTPQTRKEMIL